MSGKWYSTRRNTDSASKSRRKEGKVPQNVMNFLVQAAAAERMWRERVHSCTVKGDPHCTGCLIEAYSQPGGCPGGGFTARKARLSRPQG